MGNRAFIMAEGASTGIYLSWNGGRDSVEAFLQYAELSGLPPLGRKNEGLPAFVTVLVNFFGNHGLHVHLDQCDPEWPQGSDPGDNGVYVVNGFGITGRYGICGPEQQRHELDALLRSIDAAQPERDRLGAYLDAVEVATSDLQAGDQVLLPRRFGDDESSGRYREYAVLGRTAAGVPYVDMFEGQDNSKNPNALLHFETVKVLRPRVPDAEGTATSSAEAPVDSDGLTPYEQQRAAYWETQRAFRDQALDEMRRIAGSSERAARVVVQLDDAMPPRLSVTRLLAADGSELYPHETGLSGTLEQLDQVACDMELHYSDEVDSLLMRHGESGGAWAVDVRP